MGQRKGRPMPDVQPIPDGYPRVTPYLVIDGVSDAMELYCSVLGAGERPGSFEEPWGHRWTVATHVEDLAPEEMERRAAEVMGQAG